MKPDGGPAFPGEHIEQTYLGARGLRERRVPVEGMTLRDYFAAAALPPLIEFLCQPTHMRNIEYDEARRLAARNAYAYADAMLAEREK